MDEFNDSQSLLLEWIKGKQFDEALGSTKQWQLLTFFTKKLYPWKAHWLWLILLDTTTLDMHASGIIESNKNKVLKRHAMGTHPNQSLATSAQTTTKLNLQWTNLLQNCVASFLDATFIRSNPDGGIYNPFNLADHENMDDGGDLNDGVNDDNDDCTSVNDNGPKAAEPLNETELMFTYMDEIVDYCNQMIEKEYKHSSRLSVYKVNSELYYVKASAVKQYDMNNLTGSVGYPKYCRTRKVRVITYLG
jgi:hypothetical protein